LCTPEQTPTQANGRHSTYFAQLIGCITNIICYMLFCVVFRFTLEVPACQVETTWKRLGKVGFRVAFQPSFCRLSDPFSVQRETPYQKYGSAELGFFPLVPATISLGSILLVRTSDSLSSCCVTAEPSTRGTQRIYRFILHHIFRLFAQRSYSLCTQKKWSPSNSLSLRAKDPESSLGISSPPSPLIIQSLCLV